MVRKIYIYTCEEARRLSPKAKLPVLKGTGGVSRSAVAAADAPSNGHSNQAAVLSDKDC